MGGGSLYFAIQKTLSESLLVRYQRWVQETHATESVETLRSFVYEEAQYQIAAAETVKGIDRGNSKKENPSGKNQKYQKVKVKERSSGAGTRSFYSEEKNTQSQKDNKGQESKPPPGAPPSADRYCRGEQCSVCSDGGYHGLWACQTFRDMPVDKKWEIAKSRRACYRCLGLRHSGTNCGKSRTCGINGSRATHHRLLHKDKERNTESDPGNTKSTGAENKGTQSSSQGESKERTHVTSMTTNGTTLCSSTTEFVALRAIPVYLASETSRVMVNALLDDASSRSYLNSDVAAELGLEGTSEQITVSVLNDKQEVLNTSVVEFRITSLDGKTTRKASAYTTERVTGNMQVMNWDQQKHKWSHLENINFPKVGSRPTVDLLIGADQADLICSIRDIKGNPGEPVARLTPLGCTCVGATSCQSEGYQSHFAYYSSDNNSSLENLVRKYWEYEEPAVTQIVKPAEKEALETATNSLLYENGRYSVGIPWKAEKAELSQKDSFKVAMKRLENTEGRLMRSPEIAEAYQEVIDKYLCKGYIRKVPEDEEEPSEVWYLPHFPVVRPERTTTKTRLVFDAAAKADGMCLNDAIHQGPKLQNEIFDVLVRFRENPVALVCDISEMYLQIKLKPEDKPFHRFLWRGMNKERSPDVYEFDRVIFGVNSSPFLAHFISQQNAERHEAEYPLAAEAVKKSTYMDDSMPSVKDTETAMELQKQLSELWALAGMHARKWLSHSVEVMEQIPAVDCASEVDLDKGHLPAVKTLGLLWSPDEDRFQFQINQPEVELLTKREFLRKTATLFDPLGLIAPYIVRARILLQEIWASAVDWDEELPEKLSAKAGEWFAELESLQEIKIPRGLRTTPSGDLTFHICVDASQEAYGGAIYSRFVNDEGHVVCRPVAAKSKVAPLHSISIPRLELMGAMVGLRLAEKVGNALQMGMQSCTFWSDSTDVLFWIRGRSRNFQPFVSNRVGEIQRLTNPSQWRYIPTRENPADRLSRGMTVEQLKNDEIWWTGPAFLSLEPGEWPENKIETMMEAVRTKEANSELKKQFQQTQDAETSLVAIAPPEDRLNPVHHSNWKRLLRITARVMRFIQNCQLPSELRRRGALQPDELQEAEMHFIKLAQKETFAEEIKAIKAGKDVPAGSKLMPLKPLLDESGVLRCDGRLQYAKFLPWETRYPVILPRSHLVTRLIVKSCHEELRHGGTNHTLTQLSSQYWVIAARNHP